jgi:hypothetical protein
MEMKKIPTLFQRVFDAQHNKVITNKVTPGCEWVLHRVGTPTIKFDGACCAIIDGEIYRRYDAKQKYGKIPPKGAIPCQPEPDPITGHWPHWVKCVEGNPMDKYFLDAYRTSKASVLADIGKRVADRGYPIQKGEAFTCEAIGQHWQGNPYRFPFDILMLHGKVTVSWDALADSFGNITFESIRQYVTTEWELPDWAKETPGYHLQGAIEGLVFWKDGEPKCKIKRSDFGCKWPRI